MPSEVKDLSYEECLFLLSVDEESRSLIYKRQLEDLGSMLGTVWDIEEPKHSNSKVKQEKIMLPLTFAIGLSGMEGLKPINKYLDKARANAKNHNSSFDNANSLSKEEYLKLFGRSAK